MLCRLFEAPIRFVTSIEASARCGPVSGQNTSTTPDSYTPLKHVGLTPKPDFLQKPRVRANGLPERDARRHPHRTPETCDEGWRAELWTEIRCIYIDL